jgi:hypothetical protein
LASLPGCFCRYRFLFIFLHAGYFEATAHRAHLGFLFEEVPGEPRGKLRAELKLPRKPSGQPQTFPPRWHGWADFLSL